LEWFWTHEEYQKWSTSDSSGLLYIQGKGGTGKSTLASYFKRNLLKRDLNARSAVVASFSYSRLNSHDSMLRSIVYDLVNQDESFFTHFRSSQQVLQSGVKFPWRYHPLKRMLCSLRNHTARKRVYLIIDGIDESDEENRADFIQFLDQLCSMWKPCIVKLFLTSRHWIKLSTESHVIELHPEL